VRDVQSLRNCLLRCLEVVAEIQATRDDISALFSLADRSKQAIRNDDSLSDESRQFFMQTLDAQRQGIIIRLAALDAQQAACDRFIQVLRTLDAPVTP
jgi:hypothetical protein